MYEKPIMKKLNEKDVTAFLIYLQDYCGVEANAIATQKIKEWGLRKEHQKQTGNPDSAYEEIDGWEGDLINQL